jgi:hypothetical protein
MCSEQPSPPTSFSFDLVPEGVTRVFRQGDDGHLLFGHTARSASPTTLDALHTGMVEFTDYLMEGHISYRLGLLNRGPTLVLEVELLGGNRDQYVERHIRWHLGFRPGAAPV